MGEETSEQDYNVVRESLLETFPILRQVARIRGLKFAIEKMPDEAVYLTRLIESCVYYDRAK